MKHTIWHHLAMVAISEVVNLIWLAAAVVISIAGIAIFANLNQPFYRLVLGFPIALAGASIFLFKMHEVILVVVRPKRLAAMCKFCSSQKLENGE